jgi:hypothetical protein
LTNCKGGLPGRLAAERVDPNFPLRVDVGNQSSDGAAIVTTRFVEGKHLCASDRRDSQCAPYDDRTFAWPQRLSQPQWARAPSRAASIPRELIALALP